MATGEYSKGLCSCCDDCGVCMFTWCCFPCAAGKGAAAAANKGGFDWLVCFASCCIPLVGECMLRQKVQQAYGIQQGFCGMCCTVCCCPLCAAVQDAQETKIRGDWK